MRCDMNDCRDGIRIPTMDITPADAVEILRQIQQNRWGWLKIKRFSPDAHWSDAERYGALEKHHSEETSRMIEVITALCKTIESLEKR